jgi:hypothetical protein
MLGHRDDIFGARLSEQSRPFGGFEILRLEARDEVL